MTHYMRRYPYPLNCVPAEQFDGTYESVQRICSLTKWTLYLTLSPGRLQVHVFDDGGEPLPIGVWFVCRDGETYIFTDEAFRSEYNVEGA